MNVLIVEDNSAMRRLIKKIVSQVADEVYECGDGAEALAAYALHRPDYVLMDIEMSVMDGITATARIRAADPTAKIIIVTDYDQVELREAAQEAGACGYVVKDDLLELVRILERLDESSARYPLKKTTGVQQGAPHNNKQKKEKR